MHEVLIEESVIGWKEFELEVMRDVADNFVVICSIENIDPMGVHTGDSITVAPILTLSDKEYQRMRDAARLIIRRVGVETGGSNIQFAVNPANGRMVVIEMNPRVSRSSALASKATGFPIAKIAAKLALGYHLDEIPNDITRVTPASFEPTIDYVVVKIPRWNFEKFPQADRTLTTQMKSVGEAMAIGRTFKEAFMKGVRSLELGRSGLLFAGLEEPAEDETAHRKRLAVPTDRRLWDLFRALGRGWTVEQIHDVTKIDPWFLRQFSEISEMRRELAAGGLSSLDRNTMRRFKRAGFGDGETASARRSPTPSSAFSPPRRCRSRGSASSPARRRSAARAPRSRPRLIGSVLRTRVALKGHLAARLGEAHENPNVTLRKTLDLYANVRPVQSFPGRACRYPDLDLIVVRENTEGEYAGLEHRVVPGVVESIKITTERACTRIARFAFAHAAAARPEEGHRRPQSQHHEELGRALPRVLPHGRQGLPDDPVPGADRRQHLHAARHEPVPVRRHGDAELLRRSRVGSLRRARRRARRRAERELRRRPRGLRGHLRGRAGSRRARHREPADAARVGARAAASHRLAAEQAERITDGGVRCVVGGHARHARPRRHGGHA